MGKQFILSVSIGLIIAFFIVTIVIIQDSTKEPTEKLYFEFSKKDSSIAADGFLRYKGKWCPIVLNDSMAVIYQ